jgi:hypothetical protein
VRIIALSGKRCCPKMCSHRWPSARVALDGESSQQGLAWSGFSLAPELPKRYLSSSVLRIDMLYRLHETFFFRDLTLRIMAQELISSGKMSLQEKLDKIRSPKLQNQHQVCSSSPNLHRVPLTRARLPLCCLRSKIP